MNAIADQRTELATDRTRLSRHPERGSHDFATIAEILDEALYCHIGVVVDGQPFVVPTSFGREGRKLYIHGSAASRMLGTLSEGVPMCLTATLLDGLVIARSVFRNSMNYRSVMIVGVAQEAAGDEKLHGLEVITEHIMPGRWADAWLPTSQELKATTVLRLDIEEASAKVRRGPPADDEQDYALSCWAGELPFALSPQTAVPDARLASGTPLPAYVAAYRRPTSSRAGNE